MQGRLALLATAVTLALAFTNPVAHGATKPKPVIKNDKKEWTFLLYLNGNNNLDRFGYMNMNQMEKVGSTDKVNLVVQWASIKKKSEVERVYVIKDNDANNVTSPALDKIGKVDMGDWRNLVEFIRWGAQQFPAEHYFVAVWNHGSGWHGIQLNKLDAMQIRPMDISYDDNTGNAITTEQLGQAMREASRAIGQKIDVYASDACLMAMSEVASEMADSVQVFAGSQELEPGEGWPYTEFVTRWNAEENTTPVRVGQILTDEYVKAYNGGVYGKKSVTFSAYDLSKTDQLHDAVQRLGSSLSGLSIPDHKKVVKAARGSQYFTYADYVDMIDFADQLEKEKVSALDSQILSDLRAAHQEYVIANGASPRYARAKGVSFWVPNTTSKYNSYSRVYSSLVFNRETGWGQTLKTVLENAAKPDPQPPTL